MSDDSRLGNGDSVRRVTMSEISNIGRNIATATRYRLKREIATGGMGSVYDADQFGAEGFVKRVAIKLLLPALSKDGEFVSMFIGEAKLVAGLVHQNIVQIYQLGRSEDGFFIAMEYIDGIDLQQFMTRHEDAGKKPPVELCVYIVSRVCRGLEYAHSKRDENGELLDIVHRDVSPKNVMITSEGEVKLTDFGVAKARRQAAAQLNEDIMVGKIPYMSPEQATFQPCDGRSDIFSLGIVFYELLTGIRLFQKLTEEDSIREITRGRTPDPRMTRDDIPEEIARIVMKCLKRDPADRYSRAGDLGYELERHMYSKGYGPTIVTLAKYMSELCPDKHFYVAPSKGDDLSSSALKG